MGSHADILKIDGVDYPLAAYFNDLFKGALLASLSNTETITATKELTDDDYQFQILTASGANRSVELAPEASTNHIMIIYNAGASNNVVVKDDSGAVTFITLAPDQWAIFVPVLGETWKVMETRAHQAGYVVYAGTRGTNPLDATTYYFGSQLGEVLTTTAQRRMIHFPRAGILRAVNLIFSGTAGSNETSSISVRLNDTTDTLITNAVNLSTLPYVYNTSALNIPVTEVDYVEIKWVTPTWATNPLSLAIQAQLFVE